MVKARFRTLALLSTALNLLLVGVVWFPALPMSRAWTPVLTVSEAWEQTAIQEPNVLYRDGLYRMWYTGGWEHTSIGYAESVDGLHFHKYPQPVLGNGAGSFSGSAAHFSVIWHSGQYIMYFADLNDPAGEHAAVSTDGIHFTSPVDILSPGDADTSLANTTVWDDDTGWHMLYDSKTPADIWQMFRADGSDAFHWRKTSGPMSALNLHGSYGGAWLERHGAAYHLWYHVTTNGWSLPSDIYEADSPDLMHWSTPMLILSRAGMANVDQVADPSIADGLMYFDVMDNPHEAGYIAVLPAP